jgi:hypothetical protein
MESIFDIRRILTEGNVLLCFNGLFSQGIIQELGKAVRKYLEAEDVHKSVLADIFTIFVEATQNLTNYGNRADLNEQERQQILAGIVVIGRQEERYVVRIGNLVRRVDAHDLRGRIERLAGLDKVALKALYKERIRQEIPPGAFGAGLGLITMARIASQPLEYQLDTVEGDLDFFSLKVVV